MLINDQHHSECRKKLHRDIFIVSPNETQSAAYRRRYPPHHRRSIRLKGYDYSLEGAYFITICCQDRICRFGKIAETSPANRRMELNEHGIIAHDEWIKLTERFFNFELDVFQIMPNHMHGIIVLKKIHRRGNPCGCPK